MVPESLADRLRVALLAPSADQRRILQNYLAANGLGVIDLPDWAPGDIFGPGLADVLLVNLADAEDGDELDVALLLDRTQIPILFNDAGAMARNAPDSVAGQAWGRRLAEKLHALAGAPARVPAEPESAADSGRGATPEEPAGVAPLPSVTATEPAPGAAAEVWVLAASIGGPQALTQFVGQLPDGLPVAFVVAQHIGPGFVDLLASQLARVTPLAVRCGEQDMVLAPGQIAVAPVEQRFGFVQPGRIHLAPEERKSIYSPCIDTVMMAVADAYGPRAGAILFSGMGSDGVAGARTIAAAGGTILAQEPEGCVVSSMADGAREAGVVSFSGTPAELAHHFLERFGGCCNESVGG